MINIMINKKTLIKASKLRDKNNLENMVEDKPGYYKWWAEINEVNLLFEKLGLVPSVVNELEKRDDKYCIYVGVAIKESVRNRLNWHINQINSPSAIKSGTLSTLRQTISSVLFEDMRLTNETNEFIDKLYVEPFYNGDKEKIREIEINSLTNRVYLYLLNIQDNKHPLSPRRKISELRKKARNRTN